MHAGTVRRVDIVRCRANERIKGRAMLADGVTRRCIESCRDATVGIDRAVRVVALQTRWSGYVGRAVAAIPAMTLAGCASRGAPSFSLFGAFFPAWMLCAFVGIAAAIATRVILGAFRSADVVPYPLTLCGAVGVIFAALLWLVWFGR